MTAIQPKSRLIELAVSAWALKLSEGPVVRVRSTSNRSVKKEFLTGRRKW